PDRPLVGPPAAGAPGPLAHRLRPRPAAGPELRVHGVDVPDPPLPWRDPATTGLRRADARARRGGAAHRARARPAVGADRPIPVRDRPAAGGAPLARA